MASFPPVRFELPGRITAESESAVVSEDAWGTYVFLRGIVPQDVTATPYAQVKAAFGEVVRRLETFGMGFEHVARTWLFGADMLGWYGDLNRARHEFFTANGVYDRYVPASTGIGWTSDAGAKIVMGVFAVRAKAAGSVEVEALPSPLQCPALEYGSSFSRAAEVRTPTWRRVLVSGTASIEPNSHHVAHVGDIDAQIACTLRAVSAIYESRGMSLADVGGGLVYLKSAAFRAAWDRWTARHAEFPAARVPVIVADVCRDDWLFELESYGDARVTR